MTRFPSDGVITQGFSSAHRAIDMAFNGGGAASYGKPLFAPDAGKVTFVGQMGAVGTVNDAGTVVQITSGNRINRVCHMIPNSPTVSVGQNVSEGQLIGKMGWSGYVIPANVNGTHTHWVMEIDGVRVDGSQYITNGDEDMHPITPPELDILLGGLWGVVTDPTVPGYDKEARTNDHKNHDGKPFYDTYWILFNDPRTFEYADKVYKALNAPVSDDYEPYTQPPLFVKKK